MISKRSPYTHLYKWIRFLKDEGCDHPDILKALETCDAVKLDPGNPRQVELAKAIIRHALGEVPDSEIEKFGPPTRVIGVEAHSECPDGYVFQAVTPVEEEDFYFLVERSAMQGSPGIDDVKTLLIKHNCEIRELLLFRAQTRHYYCVEGMPFASVAVKLTWQDVCPSYLRL